MKGLVELKKGKPVTTSLKFAEEFDISHSEVLRKIRNLTKEFPIVKDQFLEDIFKNDRNREYPFYWITRDGYMTFIMEVHAKGKKSRELLFEKKQLFIKAFNKMEEELLKIQTNKSNIEWNKAREQGKQIRLELTDVIKDFVDYAISQGSKNAKRYYGNITKMQYKALRFVQEKKPKLRNLLDVLETNQLILAEDLCKRQLKIYMDEKLHYKEIYILVKLDIEKFSKSLMINK